MVNGRMLNTWRTVELISTSNIECAAEISDILSRHDRVHLSRL